MTCLSRPAPHDPACRTGGARTWLDGFWTTVLSVCSFELYRWYVSSRATNGNILKSSDDMKSTYMSHFLCFKTFRGWSLTSRVSALFCNGWTISLIVPPLQKGSGCISHLVQRCSFLDCSFENPLVTTVTVRQLRQTESKQINQSESDFQKQASVLTKHFLYRCWQEPF